MSKFLPASPQGEPKTKHNPRGFTLVELLVVISIIGILSVIGVTLFGNAQKNARDGQRRGDIDAISKAFEANATSGTDKPYAVPLKGWFASGTIPSDPQGTSVGYFWNGGAENALPTAVSATYVVCAKLENKNGNSSTKGATDGTFTAASGDSATYFCRKNQQ